MSSPDHPTANLEDVFSSNFPNYVPPVSPDYVPTSPGKTYSKAQAATMASASNPNRNTGAVGLIRWFERTESVFSRSRCAEENKVTFATGTLTNDALSWWNAYAQPMGIEQANQITWTELKRLLTNKYCPRTEIRKMEEELYNLIVKGNDLKPYVRRFQELTVLCPNMVPNNDKLLEAFIGGLPRSIEGNVTASKPQTLEEAINIAQTNGIQVVTKHAPMQVSSDNKRKFDDRRTFNNSSRSNNNYRNTNNRYNNRQQQNRRQEAGRAYAVIPSENMKLYAKFSKCDFWIHIVQFLGHLIDNQGLHVDPAKIEAVKNWTSPTTPTEVRQFLGLRRHINEIYRRRNSIGAYMKAFIARICLAGTFTFQILAIIANVGVSNLTLSTAYHPETDGQCEDPSHTLEDMLRACVIDYRIGWI
ncbi:reverse transcriptase domain-containing protein [Tanacetum coccineum]